MFLLPDFVEAAGLFLIFGFCRDFTVKQEMELLVYGAYNLNEKERQLIESSFHQ